MLYRKENYLWKSKKVELTCVNTVINRLETTSCYCWKMGHEIEDTVKFSSAANPADQLKLSWNPSSVSPRSYFESSPADNRLTAVRLLS